MQLSRPHVANYYTQYSVKILRFTHLTSIYWTQTRCQSLSSVPRIKQAIDSLKIGKNYLCLLITNVIGKANGGRGWGREMGLLLAHISMWQVKFGQKGSPETIYMYAMLFVIASSKTAVLYCWVLGARKNVVPLRGHGHHHHHHRLLWIVRASGIPQLPSAPSFTSEGGRKCENLLKYWWGLKYKVEKVICALGFHTGHSRNKRWVTKKKSTSNLF